MNIANRITVAVNSAKSCINFEEKWFGIKLTRFQKTCVYAKCLRDMSYTYNLLYKWRH